MNKDNQEAINPEQLTDIIVKLLEENKAEDIVKINLKGKAEFADFAIIATALSSRQAVSLADKVMDLGKQNRILPIQAEGTNIARWILIDMWSVVIHIFTPESRDLYRLEEIWSSNFRSNIDEV